MMKTKSWRGERTAGRAKTRRLLFAFICRIFVFLVTRFVLGSDSDQGLMK
jgi:hypothetical protein